MIGVWVNMAAVAAGVLIGSLAGRLIPEKLSQAVMTAIAFCTIYIGIKGSLAGENTLVLILSLVIGGAVGTLIDIDGGIERLGKLIERKMAGVAGAKGSIPEAFMTASLLFCVGAMTIVGSLNAGLTGDCELLYTKSLLDMIASTMLTAALGIGVLFSVAFIFIFQGGIVLLAGFLSPYLTDYPRGELLCVGSVMIVMLGLNMLGVTKVKVANYLPALLLAPLLCQFLT